MKKDQFNHLKWSDSRWGKTRKFGIFDIQTVIRQSPTGQRGTFVIADTPHWVTIIPMLNDTMAYMVRQFRHGSGMVTLEFPSGVVHRGEDPAKAAVRELLEETGCEAGSIVEIGNVNPNPAFMNNRVYTFLATDLIKVQELDLDDLELLEIEEVEIAKVMEAGGTGDFDNGVLLIALQWYRRWLDSAVHD
ncbi:MAG: NUDIX hydrolase [Spirochaetales bacterium]|nr:NUDIX hydrolase [Spirochaetales bacterium]